MTFSEVSKLFDKAIENARREFYQRKAREFIKKRSKCKKSTSRKCNCRNDL